MDYEVADLSAVPTSAYLSKIDRVENILAGLPRKPHLLSFAECCCSDALIQRATSWAANWGVVTICGSRFNPATSKIEAVIVHRAGIAIAEKNRLSPYDTQNCSLPVHPGSSPGLTFTLEIEEAPGHFSVVRVGVMICYDFRFQYQNPTFANYGLVQLIVVPMWDRKFKEPQEKAGELAERYYTRCLLVSKAEECPSSFSERNPKISLMWSSIFGKGWTHTRLPSTGHGPFNSSDLRLLKDWGADRKEFRLWEQRQECLFVGDYEVGMPVTGGHDNAYGTGFNYGNFERHSLV